MDKLAGMAMFVRVVESGSFAAAAQISNVTATMVGKHIRTLEQRLGATLIQRTTRRHALTEVGKLYFERCKRALAEVELADAAAAELQTTPRGSLTLVAPVSFGADALVRTLVDYMARYPEVSVDLTLDNGHPDLLDGRHELAIHMGKLDSTDLVARPLKPYRRILVASKDYLAARGHPQTPDDLSHHACLGPSYWQKARSVWTLANTSGETRDIATKARFTADQGQALRVAAISGAGIAVLPDLVVAEDIEAGRLEHVLPQWAYKPVPMLLVYARNRRPSAKLRSAIDFLTQRFG